MPQGLGPLTGGLLIAIVAVAFTTEATVGFGATLITLALGSLVTSIDELLYAIVPLNLVLSTAVLARSFRHVDRRALGLGILPAMAVGFPIGVVAFERLPREQVRVGFGVFVAVLGAVELVAQVRQLRGAPQERPLSRGLALALLFLGGAVHGAFASGGPPVVYVCGRTLPDKRVFRATLSALWLLLGAVLFVVHTANGHIGATSLKTTALLVPGLAIGLAGGEFAHGRLPEKTFRLLVFALLVGVGIVLAVRG
ncbi:MAG: sulfite exporter TauE/SafE family protein [Polyangiaceae bacterium]